MSPPGGRADRPDADRAAPARPRRALAYVVALCVVGAGLALYAATRTWSVELTARPTPLPPLRSARTGGALMPWLPALALVGLAGAGAVPATRGTFRRLLGALLGLVGLAVAAGGGYGLLESEHGAARPVWPALCLVGGVLLAAGGLATLARGPSWPTMGARYDRVADAGRPEDGSTTAGQRASVNGGRDAGADRMAGRRTIQAWDALDRGEDPTDD